MQRHFPISFFQSMDEIQPPSENTEADLVADENALIEKNGSFHLLSEETNQHGEQESVRSSQGNLQNERNSSQAEENPDENIESHSDEVAGDSEGSPNSGQDAGDAESENQSNEDNQPETRTESGPQKEISEKGDVEANGDETPEDARNETPEENQETPESMEKTPSREEGVRSIVPTVRRLVNF